MSQEFQCRSCGGQAGQLVLDLGLQPLANNLLRPDDLHKTEPTVPLRLMVCHQCWLMQIAHLVPPVELFSQYLYFSSFSDAMLRHAEQAATRYQKEFGLTAQSRVIEIASNDGYLLQYFAKAGVPCLGIEPAANIAKVAREKGIETITEFFSTPLATALANEQKKAGLILGNNVFAHAPDTNDFVRGLKTLLQPNGVIVLEFPYGVDFLEKTEFDTIYHEHVFYFTLLAVKPLFERHALEIFSVERIPIHGGSLRLFVGHTGSRPINSNVSARLSEEKLLGLDRPEYYEHFAARVAELRRQLTGLLRELRRRGATVAAYGASAKGSTLMNFCGLTRDDIAFVADRSVYKQGRLTPGTHLPIVSPEELVKRQPDYTLLLTWNFADEILLQQQTYRERGGKFILPIPEVRIV